MQQAACLQRSERLLRYKSFRMDARASSYGDFFAARMQQDRDAAVQQDNGDLFADQPGREETSTVAISIDGDTPATRARTRRRRPPVLSGTRIEACRTSGDSGGES